MGGVRVGMFILVAGLLAVAGAVYAGSLATVVFGALICLAGGRVLGTQNKLEAMLKGLEIDTGRQKDGFTQPWRSAWILVLLGVGLLFAGCTMRSGEVLFFPAIILFALGMDWLRVQAHKNRIVHLMGHSAPSGKIGTGKAVE